MKRTYKQDPETGKFYEVVKQKTHRGHFVLTSSVDFISPISGEHIRSSRQLAEHNKQHGVSNDLDSLREQTTRAREPVRLNARERKDNIADAYERASSSGFSRRVEYDE